MLNESAEPHTKAGASAQDSYPPWTFVRVGDVVQIQRRGLHLGPAKYLSHPSSVAQILVCLAEVTYTNC